MSLTQGDNLVLYMCLLLAFGVIEGIGMLIVGLHIGSKLNMLYGGIIVLIGFFGFISVGGAYAVGDPWFWLPK